MVMMEMKKQTPSSSLAMAPNSTPTSTTTSTSSASALGMHKNSRPISKIKPKIRIIHIFAPEIIKTDAANFRELVQRLTGKPTEQDLPAGKKKPKVPRKLEERSRADHGSHHGMIMSCYEPTERSVKEEEKCNYEFWNSDTNYSNNNNVNTTSGGGFLGGFPDLDGYFNPQEFSEFPLLYHPLLDAHHSMHVYDHEPRLIA